MPREDRITPERRGRTASPPGPPSAVATGEGLAVKTPADTVPAREPKDPERRSVCLGIASAIGVAITSALALPLIGMLLSPVLRRPRRIVVPLAPADHYRGGDPVPVTYCFRQRQGWREREVTRTIFVVALGSGELAVLSSRCSHLGCRVSWDAGADAFLCPCHDGRFDREGRRVAGPPPGPLARLRTTVRDGILYVEETAEV
jgi:Rieske Fe-S protein